ncbi:MAG: branched-chain amino acid ABC transporter permease [Syntrophobacter sp.]
MDSTLFIQLVISGLLIGGVYALISIGLTLIFGVMRIVNFAHGEFLMFAMFAAYWILEFTGLSTYVTAPLVALLLFVFGAVIYVLIIKRTVGSPMVVQIFATVGLGLIMQNVALVLWSGDFRTIRTPEASAVLKFAGIQVSYPLLIASVAAIMIALALFAFVAWTYPGKAIRATVQDRTAAQLMGIDINKVYLMTFALGSALVGIAGALLAPAYPIFPSVGTNFGLASFVVVVLGGMGSMTGALLGGLLIGLVETLSGFFIDAALKQAVYFVVFIMVLVFRPTGLLGQRGAEEVGLK